MGLSQALHAGLGRLALDAPVRVFAIEGAAPPVPVDELRLQDRLRLVDSPRSANVLLVAGTLPAPLHDAARRVHDQLSPPRITVWWAPDGAAPSVFAPFDAVRAAGTAPELAAVLGQLQRELVSRVRASEPALLPDIEPAPWRGVGPYGQGGSGMTGGVPYGRPLAGRAPDRDGLELDQLPIRVGPFFRAFPPGLMLDVKLQGDVLQEVAVGPNPFQPDHGPPEPFRTALTRPVRIAELETARARHHLRWLAHALRVQGVDALGRRALGWAAELGLGRAAVINEGVGRGLRRLARLLERTGGLGWSTGGVGIIDAQFLRARGLGPTARAAGLAEDARVQDDGYRALGFEPVVQPLDRRGDARARWRQRIDEAIQSLELAARAGDRTAGGTGTIEGPRGRYDTTAASASPTTTLLPLLPMTLAGMEWGDAVMTVVSLDLDLRDAMPGLGGAA